MRLMRNRILSLKRPRPAREFFLVRYFVSIRVTIIWITYGIRITGMAR